MNFMLFANKISLIRLRTWLSLYLVLTIIGVYRHVLWRDEMQGWLVALQSQNIFELWSANAPSGHPILYPLLTYISTLIHPNPISMQLMQWLLAAISAFLFVRYSPFTKLHKILFLFGYFPFWEYCLLSRHYVVLELLVFCGAMLVTSKEFSLLLTSIVVALLFNTHALGWGIANGFLCVSVFAFSQAGNSRKLISSAQRSWIKIFEIIFSILIVVSSVGLSFLSIIQTSRTINSSTISFDLRSLLIALGRYLGGNFLVVPNSARWVDLTLAGFASVLLIVLTALFIRSSVKALLFYTISLISLLGFNSLVYEGIGSRHFGVYFIVLIGSLWIYKADNNRKSLILSKSLGYFDFKVKTIFSRIFLVILIVHMVAGVHRVFLDYVYPYSASKDAAQYIKNSEYSQLPLFGTRDVELSSISGYLGRSIYYPEVKRNGTYTQWNDRNDSLMRENSLTYIQEYMQDSNIDHSLVVLSRKSRLTDQYNSGQFVSTGAVSIRLVDKFLRSYNAPERYYLYEAKMN